jgi:hypothetical protein
MKDNYELIVKCISTNQTKSRYIELDEIEYKKFLDKLNIAEGDYQLIMIKALKD